MAMYSPYIYQAFRPPRPSSHEDFYRSLSQDNYRTVDNYGSLSREKYRSPVSNNFGSLPRNQYRSPSRDSFRAMIRDNYRSPSYDNNVHPIYRAASRIPVRNAPTNWISLRKRVSFLTSIIAKPFSIKS